MKIVLAAIFVLHVFAASAAGPGNEAARAEMAKLAQLAGKWSGSGWMLMPSGRETFASEETVEMRLDGSALLIEGRHRETRTQAIVHHALAILAWDSARGEYRMQSALSNGRTGSFPGKFEDGRFVWRIEAPNAPMMRYTISFEGSDRWIEVGEMSRDGGKTWMAIFGMDLKRTR